MEGNFYNPDTGVWEWGYNADESTIREALEDFNDIVTQLLTSDGSIVKSLEKAAKETAMPVTKAGKSLSTKNLSALKSIYDTLGSFLSEFYDGESDTANNVQKEDIDMSREDVQKLVGDEVKKAMEPITKQLQELAPVSKDGSGETGTSQAAASSDGSIAESVITAETVAKMVGEEVSKAIESVMKALQPVMQSRALPGNLNSAAGADISKSEELHYMTGMF